jgi:FlaA1/EpsC-like NDP-sugar epimerase
VLVMLGDGWRTGTRRSRLSLDPLLPLVDSTAWVIGLGVAMAVRFDLRTGPWSHWSPLTMAAIAVVVQFGAGTLAGLYAGRWRRGSVDESLALVGAAAVTGVALFAANDIVSGDRLVPASVVLGAAPTAICVSKGVRFLERVILEQRTRRRGGDAGRVVVFGAGDGGTQLIDSMLDDSEKRWAPVALLDDDPAKWNLRIRGVPVAGGRDQLVDVVKRHGARLVVVAAPSISSESLRDLSSRALAIDVAVRVVPPVTELIDGHVGTEDVRPITEADLLGRHQVDCDIASVSGYLTGRRVLVTGAGGSIGSELSRQIHRFGPSRLILLDRDESALHSLQLALHGRALLDDETLVVADIRDGVRIGEIFDRFRPEVVFHTAALKHLPLLEMQPAEAVKTNVHGTLNVLRAAAAAKVDRFVNISTDKAADPASVLGYTKRISERLTSWFSGCEPGVYLSVRFGNVLGSRGSVLGAFERQVAEGGPITVTHPEVTRFFMTATEAVQLVIQAGAVGNDGEALVLDMGEPVRIDDVARRLATQAERRIEIVYTGLRPGEKLHEILLGAGEVDSRPAHARISHVNVPASAPVGVEDLHTGSPESIREALMLISSEPASSEETLHLP